MRSCSFHCVVVVAAGAYLLGCSDDEPSYWFGENGNQGAIAAGALHTCAVTQGGGVKCWGDNSSGQLGDGSLVDSAVPVLVSGIGDGVRYVAAGERHSCVLTLGGAVMCFGDNTLGQLGDDSLVDRLVPTQVVGLESGVARIAAGGDHSCALMDSGAVKCWGDNTWGSIGDGTIDHRRVPTQVVGLDSGVVAIDAGLENSCAVTSKKEAWCWGHTVGADIPADEWEEALKVGNPLPVKAPGLDEPVQDITADSQVCVLTTRGGVKCKGAFGPMVTFYWGGIWLSDTMPAMAITGSEFHGCGIDGDGGVRCWGWNENGELGDGTYTLSMRDVPVQDLSSGVIAVSTGGKHTCALLDSGKAMCWGDNKSSQLGDHTGRIRSSVPIEVPGFP